jgi:uncharacterized protein (TIGR03000 family)
MNARLETIFGETAMTKPHGFLIPCMLAGAGLLLLAGESEAQRWRFRGGIARRSVYPPGWPNRMPGWDERYIYPWSPYNIGRNPYNPGYFVGPYPVYLPYDQPYPIVGDGGTSPTYQAPGSRSEVTPAQLLLPDPTGTMTAAPATAAVIQLRVPDPFAEVEFDGVKTESVGRTRYYVTPDLTADKRYPYEVTARWKRGDNWVTEARTIQVRRGKITTLDFTS